MCATMVLPMTSPSLTGTALPINLATGAMWMTPTLWNERIVLWEGLQASLPAVAD